MGEVRGGEAFDLLQAMNTGHDGSMGTVHANSPREALRRLETMITGGGYSLPARNIREMIANSIDVIIHAARLRDGRRVITHITELIGMEEDIITTQDLYLFHIDGDDGHGHVIGRHSGTGITQPKIWSKAVYFGEQARLAAALQVANSAHRSKADRWPSGLLRFARNDERANLPRQTPSRKPLRKRPLDKATPLPVAQESPYIQQAVARRSMAINGLRNKLSGPGGGTRHLHMLSI